jgi:hypothetical protein
VLASRGSQLPGRAQLLLGNVGSPRRSASLRLCGLSALTRGRTRPKGVAVFVEAHPDLGEAVFTPAVDNRPYRLKVDDDRRCASGRLPLPSERGALVAYIQVR